MEFANLERWPKDSGGMPEEAALLCTAVDIPGDLTVFCSMLESFGIPYLGKRQGAAQYINILFGRSIDGVEIYVPASRLEEAKELLDAPPEDDSATF